MVPTPHAVQTLKHGGQNFNVPYEKKIGVKSFFQNTSQPKNPIYDKAIPSLCFLKQKYKRNPDPKIEKLSPVWGLRRHILLTTNSQPTPQKKRLRTNKRSHLLQQISPTFGLFRFKRFSKDSNHPLPQKIFSHQLLAKILCQKDGKRSPRVLQPKVQSLQ